MNSYPSVVQSQPPLVKDERMPHGRAGRSSLAGCARHRETWHRLLPRIKTEFLTGQIDPNFPTAPATEQVSGAVGSAVSSDTVPDVAVGIAASAETWKGRARAGESEREAGSLPGWVPAGTVPVFQTSVFCC